MVSAELDTSKDQLVVATNAAFEPFEFMKGDNTAGLTWKSRHAGGIPRQELAISNMNFDAVLLSVEQGKADIAMAGLTVNEEKTAGQLLGYLLQRLQKIIVMEKDKTFDDCETAEDVEKSFPNSKGTKVGFRTALPASSTSKGTDWGFDGFKNLKGVGYASGSLAVQDMVNGNIKLVVIDEEPANSIAKATNELN